MAIPTSEAEGYITHYLDVLDEMRNKQDLTYGMSPKACNYLASDLISFIFTKERIDALFAEGGSNALRIYYAAHEDGEPTVVLVPCQLGTTFKDGADRDVLQNQMLADQTPDKKLANQVTPGFDLAGDSVNG